MVHGKGNCHQRSHHKIMVCPGSHIPKAHVRAYAEEYRNETYYLPLEDGDWDGFELSRCLTGHTNPAGGREGGNASSQQPAAAPRRVRRRNIRGGSTAPECCIPEV